MTSSDGTPPTAEVMARLEALEAAVHGRLAAIEARLDQLSTGTAFRAPPPPTGGPGHPPPTGHPTALPPPPPPTATPSRAGPPTGYPAPLPPPPPPPPPSTGEPGHPPPTDLPPPPSSTGGPAHRAARPGGSGRAFTLSAEALLRWAGVGLVVLAGLFLVSTAISRGWIGPELQLLGAASIGAALLVASTRLVAVSRPWSAAMGHGGSIVLVASAAATSAWLDLVAITAALALVTVAMAISLAVAVGQDMAGVGGTTVATGLIVATWMEAWTDAPLWSVAAWLVAIALTAVVLDRRTGWTLFRLAVTWTVAVLVLALAATRADDLAGADLALASAVVALVTIVVWTGPLAGRVDPAVRPRQPSEGLRALDHRAVAAIPLWLWTTVAALAEIATGRAAGWLGLGLAVGFAVAAGGAMALGAIERRLAGSHVLGASILVTASAVAALGGPVLVVVMAAQAVAALLVARWFGGDRFLRLNAAALGTIATLMLTDALFEAARADRIDAGATAANAAVVVALAVLAWLVGDEAASTRTASSVSATAEVATSEPDPPVTLPELVTGVAWAAALGLVASLIIPFVASPGALALTAGFTLVSLAASPRLGRAVLAVGAGLLTGLVVGGGGLLAVALVDDTAPVTTDLANLAAVGAIGLVTAARWRPGAGPTSPGPGDRIGPGLFVLTWLGALAWLASVLLALPEGQAMVSASWVVLACGGLVVGVVAGDRLVRAVGLATLGVVLFKLLTVDLAEVDVLWRVVLFLGIGVGLLRLGYVLPRLAARQQIDQPDRGDS